MRALKVCAALLALAAALSTTLRAEMDLKALRELVQSAEKGNIEAQFQLGQHYWINNNLSQINVQQAEIWLSKAASHDHLGAIISLAMLYSTRPELGGTSDEVAKWLGKAADMGHVPSSTELGLMLWRGARYVEKDRPQAYRRLREATLLRDERAALALANFALDGDGVERDPTATRKILTWAANHGSVAADIHLLAMSDKDYRLQSLPSATGKVRSFAKKGDPRALTILARAYETGVSLDQSNANASLTGRLAEARKYYEQAANKNDPEANARLGMFYLKGIGGSASPEKARTCFEKSAAANHPLGQLNLALFMLSQNHASKPDMERVKQLLAASAPTLPEAAFALGMIFYEGNGTPKDPVAATHNFSLAADQGHLNACINLGVMAANGENGPVDLKSAARWWTMASLNGSNQGLQLLGRIAKRLSEDDLKEINDDVRNQRAALLATEASQLPELTLKR